MHWFYRSRAHGSQPTYYNLSSDAERFQYFLFTRRNLQQTVTMRGVGTARRVTFYITTARTVLLLISSYIKDCLYFIFYRIHYIMIKSIPKLFLYYLHLNPLLNYCSYFLWMKSITFKYVYPSILQIVLIIFMNKRLLSFLVTQ